MNQKQLNVYSVKIADLILRTVAEIENLLKELCHKEGIKFLDKNRRKRKIVNFHEYHEKIEEKYLLSKKYVATVYDGFSEDLFFGGKILPFRRKEMTKNGKKIQTISWHHAYNMIKHDRTKNFKHANLENLITALAALFLLNVFHKGKEYNSIDDGDINGIMEKIRTISDTFEIDAGVDINSAPYVKEKPDSFLDPAGFCRISAPYCVYIIQYNQKIKTQHDDFMDGIEKIEASSGYLDKETKEFKPKYFDYKFTDHKSECDFIIRLNKRIV